MILAPISRGDVVDCTGFYPLIYGGVKGCLAKFPGYCQPYPTNLDVEMAILLVSCRPACSVILSHILGIFYSTSLSMIEGKAGYE